MSSKYPLVFLGFIETSFDEKELTSDYFPDKIGGRPAWLDLGNIPNNTDIQCSRCNKQMSFLMQIYAPWEEQQHCYHRVLYLFCCNKGSCAQFRVFRSQLPQINAYYERDQEQSCYDSDFTVSKDKLTARVPQCTFCGFKAPNHCGKCKMVHYCCREHQTTDWDLGHREQCNKKDLSIPKRKSEYHYKEMMIVTEDKVLRPILIKPKIEDLNNNNDDSDNDEEEDDYDTDKAQATEEEIDCKASAISDSSAQIPVDHQTMDKYHDYLDQTGKSDEYTEKTFTNLKDRQLAIFNASIRTDNDQVLRYSRDSNYQVLWVSEDNVPTQEQIPVCPLCKSPRHVEMQVMPQMLHFLDIDSTQMQAITSIDFGILTVYTCGNSCSFSSTNGLQEEFIYKQDFTK